MNNQILEITTSTGLDQITAPINGMFSSAQTAGMAIVISAITIGSIFVASAFIWGLAKIWLKRSRG